MKLRVGILSTIACATSLVLLSGCSSKPADSSATETASAPANDAAPTAAAAGPVAPAAGPVVSVAFSSLTGDATKGKTIFVKCMACHSIKEGENRVGPSLHGIIGRTAGQVAGFSYSNANKGSGIVWSKEKIFQYLEAPQKMVPGTKMSFVGLPVAQDRADVIAYLDAND
jgi:cytochrome c